MTPAWKRDWYALPLQGKTERRILYEWIASEEEYVENKFADRGAYDATFAERDFSRWLKEITQYLDRARVFLDGARAQPDRRLEALAQQAIAKAMMTTKACVESSIRVYGPMPPAGRSSGEIPKRWLEEQDG